MLKTFAHGITLALILASSCGTARAEKGYKLYQFNEMFGPQIMTVGQSGILIEAPKHRMKLMITAPKYNLTCVNDESRTYADTPIKMRGGYKLEHMPQEYKPHLVPGDTIIAGCHTQHYWYYDKDTIERLPKKDKDKQKNSAKVDFWITRDISLPPDFARAVLKFTRIPDSQGLPLRIGQYEDDGHLTLSYDTKRVQRCDTPAKLVPPRGYRKVDEFALLLGPGSEDNSTLDNALNGVESVKSSRWAPGLKVKSAKQQLRDFHQRSSRWEPNPSK